jgi:Na+/H+-dicarboxylate symporter/ABC-type amino acid transport substrate-binding protein
MAGIGGICTGLFFGESAAMLKPVGQLYILLLEVAVYPYLICSLLHGLGSMQPGQALRLVKAGWPAYLGLWVVTFGVLWLLTLAIPEPKALVWNPGTQGFSMDRLLQALIPSDIVAAIGNNSIPAVILFGIFYGIALQHVSEKRSLLQTFDALAKASLAFWRVVVRLVPLAVFALFASTAGTERLGDMESIGYLVLLFFAGALLLIVWLLPAMMAALLPVRHRDVILDLRGALLLGLVTTISVSALPYIVSATKRLADRCGIQDEERDDIIRTNISVAYPLGQIGNFFVYFFIVFCAFLLHAHLSTVEQVLLPFVSLLSCFGSPTASVASALFLGNWVGIGPSAQSLYVELMVILRYPQVAASIMAFAFLSFTVVLAYYGKLRVRWVRLSAVIALTFAVLTGGTLGARALYEEAIADRASPYLDFSLADDVTAGVTSRILTKEQAKRGPKREPGAILPQIQRSGVLRVGFNASVIPFCYRNRAEDLVGFDVAYAYRLAHDINVRLEFVPFAWQSLESDLQAGRFDIAMSGVYVTEDRLAALALSRPYHQSALAFFTLREKAHLFADRAEIDARTQLRIGVFDDPVLRLWLGSIVPRSRIRIVDDYDELPDFQQVDAALWTLLQSEALAAAHPEVVAVAPEGIGSPVLFTYLMRKDAVQLRNYVDYWLELQEADGFKRTQSRYWFERQARSHDQPRWSILRNVLGVSW